MSNEREGDLERESPESDQSSQGRNSSPTESQLEDIDIEQCDFVSEESKISPEDELIELLKSGAIDMSSPEYSRDSIDVAEEDQQESSVMDLQSLPEEDKGYNSVELDAIADNKTEAKSDAESDSSDDVIERFDASMNEEEQRKNFTDNVGVDLEAQRSFERVEQEAEMNREGAALEGDELEAQRSLENEEQEAEINEGGAFEDDELENTALSETSANIEKLVARLGEIENELSESEEEGLGTREATRKSSDEEFEEVERLLYEEKARIEAEEKSKTVQPVNDSDEEFERLEKALYEQKVRSEVPEKETTESPEEFVKSASDDEFEQLENMAYDEKDANQAQPEDVVKKRETLESQSPIENQKEDSKPFFSRPNFPVASRKTEEEDDLLDIIGSSDSEISDISESSEDLEEVQKLILAQAPSEDRETLGSDEEEKAPVMWSVSVRTSAPAPPVAASVASEHNVIFVSTETSDRGSERTNERTKELTNERGSERARKGKNERPNKSTNERASERTNEQASERTKERASERENEGTSDQTSERTNERESDKTNERTHARTIERTINPAIERLINWNDVPIDILLKRHNSFAGA